MTAMKSKYQFCPHKREGIYKISKFVLRCDALSEVLDDSMPAPGQTLEDLEPLEEIWQCDCQTNSHGNQMGTFTRTQRTPLQNGHKQRKGEYEKISDCDDYGGDK